MREGKAIEILLLNERYRAFLKHLLRAVPACAVPFLRN